MLVNSGLRDDYLRRHPWPGSEVRGRLSTSAIGRRPLSLPCALNVPCRLDDLRRSLVCGEHTV
jgi:hypothetical protein